jgi:hypothetical protein
MAAPYVLRDTSNGLFEIVSGPEHDAPKATPTEHLLATAIIRCLAWVRDEPEDSRPLLPAYVDELRTIAKSGLTDPDNRNAERATEAFIRQYGPLEPDKGPTTDPPPQGAYLVTLDEDKTIRINVIPGGPKPTDEQIRFIGELDRQDRLVRLVYDRAEKGADRRIVGQEKAIRQLLWAARFALEGIQPEVTMARLAMQSVLQDTIQKYGTAVREDYMSGLFRAYAATITVTTLVLIFYLAATQSLGGIVTIPHEVVVPRLNVILLIVALWWMCIGALLSAAVRLEPDSPEVLDSIFRSTFGAKLKALYVLGFGFVGLLLLHKQVIVFSFGTISPSSKGGFTTAYVLSRLSAAILTGAFLGLGEAALPNAVVQRSANLIAALTPK